LKRILPQNGWIHRGKISEAASALSDCCWFKGQALCAESAGKNTQF